MEKKVPTTSHTSVNYSLSPGGNERLGGGTQIADDSKSQNGVGIVSNNKLMVFSLGKNDVKQNKTGQKKSTTDLNPQSQWENNEKGRQLSEMDNETLVANQGAQQKAGNEKQDD